MPKITIERETLIDLIAQHLRDTYHCTRVWRAWQVGTMGEDDFCPVDESDTPVEIADAVLAALAAQPAEPNMRHPKIQALIGGKARAEIELGLVEQLLEDPNFETTPMDMEHWGPLHDKLKAALTAQPAEPVAWMVEGWHEGKLIARIPHLSLEKAKESAAVFSQHYTTTKIVLLYDAPPAPAAVPLTDGDELWLWRNGDHLLAFRHLYPCYSPGGDPMTLGEPVARAVFRSSHDRATKQEE